MRVGPDMVWRRHVDQLLEATARSTTAKELMAREDSEAASTAPVDFAGPGSLPRRYPERNRRGPQRLDL